MRSRDLWPRPPKKNWWHRHLACTLSNLGWILPTIKFNMLKQGDVISYLDMCREEGVNLQRGMNYRLKGRFSVILMSLRPGAPYADRIEDNGKILIYEGHDIPHSKVGPKPKLVDQPERNPGGTLTQNGLFFRAAMKYSQEKEEPELVKVYTAVR